MNTNSSWDLKTYIRINAVHNMQYNFRIVKDQKRNVSICKLKNEQLN